MNEKFTDLIENNSKLVLSIGTFILLLPFLILLFSNNKIKENKVEQNVEQVDTGTNKKTKEVPKTVSPFDKNYSSEKVAIESLIGEKEENDSKLKNNIENNITASINYMLSLNHFSEISDLPENHFSPSQLEKQKMFANVVNNGFIIEENSIKVFSNGNKENYHVIFNMYDSVHDNRITYKIIYYPGDQKFEILEFYGSLSKSFAKE